MPTTIPSSQAKLAFSVWFAVSAYARPALNKLQALVASLMFAALPLLAAQPDAMVPVPPTAAMLGYSTHSAIEQRGWVQRLWQGVTADAIRENMRRLSARPHHLGSPYDKDNAEWILAPFKEWGFEAKIETFNVLFPTPKLRVLEMLAPRSSVLESVMTENWCNSRRPASSTETTTKPPAATIGCSIAITPSR